VNGSISKGLLQNYQITFSHEEEKVVICTWQLCMETINTNLTTLMVQITKYKQQIETKERGHELHLTKIEWSALLTNFCKIMCRETAKRLKAHLIFNVYIYLPMVLLSFFTAKRILSKVVWVTLSQTHTMRIWQQQNKNSIPVLLKRV
jgi:hypothetical protein